jgi:WD40 repeat protein
MMAINAGVAARLWDAATGQPIGPPMKHDGPVSGALLTRDLTRILSWSEDRTLRLWDVATGQPIGPQTRFLSWSDDNTVRLWDVATGQQIGPAMKHDDYVIDALLTKDETRFLSWSSDNTLRLWNAGWPRGNLLEVVCALLPIEDRDASTASRHYGVTIRDPICTPATATLVPGWSQIERAPPD